MRATHSETETLQQCSLTRDKLLGLDQKCGKVLGEQARKCWESELKKGLMS
jgi:hypothetical protein